MKSPPALLLLISHTYSHYSDKMLRLMMTLPAAMAMPAVDHRAERQAMVRSVRACVCVLVACADVVVPCVADR